jgi:23S rRNA (cytidine1920-2'-O)/16S rRNA (cytidine1409-2'-O)-methyltransferase
VGKGGIVREMELHKKACDRIQSFVESKPGLEWKGLTESSIQGTEGNREFLAWIHKHAEIDQ